MAPNEGVFIRVPSEAKEPLLDLAKLLRDNPKVLPRLRGFLKEQSDPAAGSPTLTARVELLEQDVKLLKERVVADIPLPTPQPVVQTSAAPVAGILEEQTDIEDLLGTRQHPQPHPSMNPEWFNGREGRARRLSPEGERELERRIATGFNDKDIALTMGCAVNTVSNRRKAMGHAEEGGPAPAPRPSPQSGRTAARR